MNEPNSSDSRRVWWWTVLAGAIVCSLSIAFFLDGNILEIYRLQARKQQLKSTNENLQQRLRALEIRRSRLHEDPRLIEDLARRQLGLRRPGEKIIRLDDPGDTAVRSTR